MRRNYLAFGVPDFTDTEIAEIARVIRSGWIGMGEETIAFENELSDYLAAPEVVSVNSCTSALFLALLIEGIGPGDEVIVPSFNWCAAANVVLQLGAKVIFCDVDAETMCVGVHTVLAKLTSRTKAVIPVHYGGFGLDVDVLREALPRDVVIIEDAAHSLGAHYPNGKRVGASGNSVCFSFYANKNLSTGEGGAIALFDRHKADHLRCLRMNGMGSNAWSRYTNPSIVSVDELTELGYKMNFTDLQAALGRVQLNRLDKMAKIRLELAQQYSVRLEQLKTQIPLQKGVLDAKHARHLMVAIFDPAKTGIERNDLLISLRAKNIGATIHYRPLHCQPLYAVHGTPNLPTTVSLAEKIMTLPISAKMTVDDVDYVVENIANLLIQSKS